MYCAHIPFSLYPLLFPPHTSLSPSFAKLLSLWLSLGQAVLASVFMVAAAMLYQEDISQCPILWLVQSSCTLSCSTLQASVWIAWLSHFGLSSQPFLLLPRAFHQVTRWLFHHSRLHCFPWSVSLFKFLVQNTISCGISCMSITVLCCHQTFCPLLTPYYEENKKKSDSHSPYNYRWILTLLCPWDVKGKFLERTV